MYRYIRQMNKKNPNPMVVGRNASGTTSKQVTDYVLCAECEDLFNKNGEKWMLSQIWNGKRFPLRERLNVAMPAYYLTGAVAFSGTAVGIDVGKLGYFALSVLWRGAVHIWNTPFGSKTNIINLGSEEEPIRKFLLGDEPFPQNVVVMAHVCTDIYSTQSFFVPSPVSGTPFTSFSFLTLGILFRIFVGSNIPVAFRDFCCVKSGRRLIFQRDCSEKTIDSFAQLKATSKQLAKNP
jgi:hypothetical protein